MSIPPTTPPDAPPPRTDIDFSLNPRILLTAVGLMLIACWLAWYFIWRPFPVDSAIPHYTKVDHLSGHLVSVGSDTLADVMVLCSRGFKTIYPDVTIQLEQKGSATAPPALIDGKSQLAPMSRSMTDDEVAAFVNKYRLQAYFVSGSPRRPRYLCEQEKPHSRPDLTAARWNILEHAQAGRAIA